MVLIQDFVPLDASVLWSLNDAYYAARGRAAWDSHEVPFYATTNFAVARQTARLLIAHVTELERRGPLPELSVLEIGSGSGRFAINFFRALRKCGAAGSELASRIRYV